MKIQIESTTKIVTLNGIPCRIWEGITSEGIAVHAYISRIAAKEGQDLAQFVSELVEHRPPSPEVEAIPLRMIL